MEVTATQTVRDIAVALPSSTRLFEKLGIDYCCGGGKSLAEACSKANVKVDEILASLESLQGNTATGGSEWESKTMSEMIRYIVDRHHVYTRDELERLVALFNKVCSVHGSNHPELLTARKIFAKANDDLIPHMMKEEQILFPYVEDMESAELEGRRAPAPFFGTVKNPIQMMLIEHDAVGDYLRELRAATANYALPADACISYQTLYSALQELEEDLHVHIHLENNILFPRAAAMEDSALVAR